MFKASCTVPTNKSMLSTSDTHEEQTSYSETVSDYGSSYSGSSYDDSEDDDHSGSSYDDDSSIVSVVDSEDEDFEDDSLGGCFAFSFPWMEPKEVNYKEKPSLLHFTKTDAATPHSTKLSTRRAKVGTGTFVSKFAKEHDVKLPEVPLDRVSRLVLDEVSVLGEPSPSWKGHPVVETSTYTESQKQEKEPTSPQATSEERYRVPGPETPHVVEEAWMQAKAEEIVHPTNEKVVSSGKDVSSEKEVCISTRKDGDLKEHNDGKSSRRREEGRSSSRREGGGSSGRREEGESSGRREEGRSSSKREEGRSSSKREEGRSSSKREEGRVLSKEKDGTVSRSRRNEGERNRREKEEGRVSLRKEGERDPRDREEKKESRRKEGESKEREERRRARRKEAEREERRELRRLEQEAKERDERRQRRKDQESREPRDKDYRRAARKKESEHRERDSRGGKEGESSSRKSSIRTKKANSEDFTPRAGNTKHLVARYAPNEEMFAK